MLDENLPTFRLQPSADNPQHTYLYFTHNGSEPAAEYVLKRPTASESRHQYAVGLLDVHYASVIYGEVVVRPEWSQPSLSAAELRAHNGVSPPPIPQTPESFAISLYNPDQSIAVRHHTGGWKGGDSWEFEVPERSFRVPSASEIDKDRGGAVAELAPKALFRWKRDGRLSKDMTCYMCGRTVGGKKNKEPDITVALFRAAKTESFVTIYEPNMARVDVEDRKGLEVALILGAEVVRDLYLAPRQDTFNTGGAPPPVAHATRPNAQPPPPPPPPMASGALGVDTETKRLQDMVAHESRQARDQRDAEEQQRIRQMLDREENDRRRREAEVERETERLRQQYGVRPTPPVPNANPSLPPRQNQFYASGGAGWPGTAPPPRPSSVGPPGGKKKHSNPLSGLFHRSGSPENKIEKKRSVHF